MEFHQAKLGRGSEIHAKALRESITEEFDKYKKNNGGRITREDLTSYYVEYYKKNPGSITIQLLDNVMVPE